MNVLKDTELLSLIYGAYTDEEKPWQDQKGPTTLPADKRIDPEMSFTHWSYNIRGTSTDTRPTNITEGAD